MKNSVGYAAAFASLCDEDGHDSQPVVVCRYYKRPTQEITDFILQADKMLAEGLSRAAVCKAFGITERHFLHLVAHYSTQVLVGGDYIEI